MTFRAYVTFMGLSTALAWTAWIILLWMIDPFQATTVVFVFFYLTLLTGLIGTICLSGLLYRMVVLKRQEVVIREVKITFRHAVVLSCASVIALILSSQNNLQLWVLLVLIGVACLIEYIFLLVQHSRRG